MSEIQFQWITPVGGVTSAMSLEESSELIWMGRVFPAQFVSQNGETPIMAASQPYLREAWERVAPSEESFSGEAGRVNALMLGKIFAHCALQRSHGRLFVRHNESGLQFALRFASGQLIEVSAFDPQTYLGQLCLQQNQITSPQLLQAIEYAKNHKTRLGEALIQLDYLSEKSLNQLLAEQMFVRIRKIACFPYVDVRFCEDQSAAQVTPAARISGYSLLEITLGYGLSDASIKQYVGDLMNRPILIDRTSQALRMVSGEDREVLKKINTSGDLTPLMQRGDWTQRDGALKAIAWDLISIFTVPRSFALTQEYAKLEGERALHYLGLERFAGPENTAQVLKSYAERLELDSSSESAEEEHIKRAIRARLQQIAKLSQGSERDRRIYQKMIQIGADPSNQQLRASMLFEACIQEGEAALKRQRYEEARIAYADALKIQPQDVNAQLNEAWSAFLHSDRDGQDFEKARAVFQRLIQRSSQQPSQSTKPLLFLAWLQRLHGQLKEAEQTLRQILELEPEHVEAQAELRLLYNREYDQKKRKVKVFQRSNPEANQWILASAILLVISGTFWGLANLIPHSRSVWPEDHPLDIQKLEGARQMRDRNERIRTFSRSLRTAYKQSTLVNTAYQLGLKPHPKAEVIKSESLDLYSLRPLENQERAELERIMRHLYQQFFKRRDLMLSTLKDSMVIPPDMRLLGNVEHYWLNDDLFGWGRRVTLVVLGLLGFLRLRGQDIQTSHNLSLSLLAILYGAIIGYLSPSFHSQTAIGTLSLMKVTHSLGEVLFFQCFIGLMFLRAFRWQIMGPLVGVSLGVAIFKMSLLYVWFMETEMMLLIALQAGVFIGGGSLFLFWKSKSWVPPLLAHLTLTFLPMLHLF